MFQIWCSLVNPASFFSCPENITGQVISNKTSDSTFSCQEIQKIYYKDKHIFNSFV
jgi:hypothetical protein